MSLDFQQVRQQVNALGKTAPERERILLDMRARILNVLDDNQGSLDILQQYVDVARENNPKLRCALPTTETLKTRTPSPPYPNVGVLVAADGSQINPDREAPTDYFLINTGSIKYRLNTDTPPKTRTKTELFYEKTDVYTESGLVSNGLVALRRDLAERTMLMEEALDEKLPEDRMFALVDGPVEIWVAGDRDLANAPEVKRAFDDYLGILIKMYENRACFAGYVDKPRADLVVRLLELAYLYKEQKIDKMGLMHPFSGMSDAQIFGQFLEPGERSAVFGVQSRNLDQYQTETAIHFFYLNVGPHIARVEFPAWVAEDAQMLNDLHAILIQQCRILGSRPYPYMLHRAHEIAVVKYEEKHQLNTMIATELRNRGLTPDLGTNKQYAKDISGSRGRFGG